jgi:tetratricopeptide (TPR) repeat protein
MVLVLPGLALAQGKTQATTKAGTPADGFQARVQKAARLYEELEYEQALDALTQARAMAKTDDERTQVAMYEGVVQADLGQRPRSLVAFREALSLKLDAQLPVKVSPKVARDFETVRSELKNERAVLDRAKAVQPSVVTDRPTQPVEKSPGLIATPTTTPPETVPVGGLDTPSLNEERSSKLRPLPLALLGAGVVAGGVGSYFGLQSKGNIQNARDSDPGDQQSAYLDQARGQALAANILFGVAATAAAGAVITWFTGKETAHAEEVSP